MTADDRAALAAILAELERRQALRLRQFFPDDGPHRRELYPKHLEFFKAGATFTERMFLAANRIGKSESGAYEVTCHLTGLYPPWWEGKRFDTPIEVWACGTNSQTTRDIVQAKLLGPWQRPGTGMIPAHLIQSTHPARGIPGLLESAQIRHVSGGISYLGLKYYEQGRASFEGTAKHVVWDDEEPPADVYTEQLYRTLTTKGIMLVTFTPLQGMSEVVTSFLEPTEESKRFKTFIQAGWKDVPHLDETQKAALLASTPLYQVQARTNGEPTLGAGAIYPIAEPEILIPTRTLPDTWRRGYALDIGWNRTAVVWAAEDPGSGALILYDEHYQGQGEPASHARAIQARGTWLRGVIDPAAFGTQLDGKRAIDLYRSFGLKLEPAENTVEAGLTAVWDRLVTGRLKVMEHLHNWRSEFRKYHRDEKGKIVKANDHLMDATRYLVMSGVSHLTTKPRPQQAGGPLPGSVGGWMGV